MDVRDKKAGCDEHKETDEQGGQIKQQDDGQVELHRGCVDIVAGGVEMNEPRLLLQHDDAYAYQVAPEQSASDDEGGKPQEGVSHHGVTHAQRLQYAYHLGTFQNDDEQSANHGEACHTDHEHQDNPHIDVE